MNKEVAICIITYKRPIMLRKCIESVLSQTYGSFELFIVDNDEKKSSERIINFMNHDSKIQIKYLNEPNKGIPFARNKGVRFIKNNYKYLVFIDDDEIAISNWLDNLYNTIIENNADVVSGPVYSYLNPNSPGWLKTELFYRFKKKKYKTGDLIKNCATNNVIINTKIFQQFKIPFLEKFKNTGGSDSHFFQLVHENNYKMIWCNEAIVYEYQNNERLSIKWNLTRFYRVGNSQIFSLKNKCKYFKIFKVTLESIFKIITSIVIFLPNLILFLLGYKNPFYRMIKRFFKSIGFIFGTLGHKLEDYTN